MRVAKGIRPRPEGVDLHPGQVVGQTLEHARQAERTAEDRAAGGEIALCLAVAGLQLLGCQRDGLGVFSEVLSAERPEKTTEAESATCGMTQDTKSASLATSSGFGLAAPGT
jgi:hypothetical protein